MKKNPGTAIAAIILEVQSLMSLSKKVLFTVFVPMLTAFPEWIYRTKIMQIALKMFILDDMFSDILYILNNQDFFFTWSG